MMTTEEVEQVVDRLSKLDPFVRYNAIRNASPGIAAYWRAVSCTASDFKEVVGAVAPEDLASLRARPEVMGSRVKMQAIDTRIRKWGRKNP